MNIWIVFVDSNSGDENPIYYEVVPTKERAIELYDEWKRDLKEYVDDTGLTGDECIYIAQATKAMLPVTITDEEEVAFHFEWEEFEQEPCAYCENIDQATPASPRHNYNYCPMCGRRR